MNFPFSDKQNHCCRTIPVPPLVESLVLIDWYFIINLQNCHRNFNLYSKCFFNPEKSHNLAKHGLINVVIKRKKKKNHTCYTLSSGHTRKQIPCPGPSPAHRLQVLDSEPSGVLALLQHVVSSLLVISGQEQTQIAGYVTWRGFFCLHRWGTLPRQGDM